jgi:hypothetical protein
MRCYRVVAKSGRNIDIVANAIIDDPGRSEIFFFQDEARTQVSAMIKRTEVAGLIMLPDRLGVNPRTF